MQLQQFLERLPDARRSGPGYRALCPAHHDRNPSLSIREGNDGRILIKCHAGCTAEAVVAALGLHLSDLMPPGARPAFATVLPARASIAATYDYRDEHGRVLFQNVRLVPKSFRLRRPDGEGGWLWNVDGVRRVPYRLPGLIATVRAGAGAVFIVEGEKDADNLWQQGLAATTNVGGAGKWGPEETAAMASLPGGPAEFIILPDNDLAGAKHAAEVRFLLRQAGLAARIVELPGLPAKGDVSDWLGQGHTAIDLLLLTGCRLSRSPR
jgi:putative DNA primase/helicase